jgi:hypothetical protein
LGSSYAGAIETARGLLITSFTIMDRDGGSTPKPGSALFRRRRAPSAERTDREERVA